MYRCVEQVLFSLGCIKLSPGDPFTYASGLQGPIYCDNRLIVSDIAARNFVIDEFAKKINELHWDFDVIAGMATAGIPHAAWLAQLLNKPFIYVRSTAKEHGKKSAIEGRLDPQQKVILIEDLVNQAKSSAQGIENLRREGAIVSGLLAIVDYQMQTAHERLLQLDTPLAALATFQSLISYAQQNKQLSEQDVESLQNWQENPSQWASS